MHVLCGRVDIHIKILKNYLGLQFCLQPLGFWGVCDHNTAAIYSHILSVVFCNIKGRNKTVTVL